MAIPPNAAVWTQQMDPADVIEYEVELGGTGGLLETSEKVDLWTLTLSAEAAALGLNVGTGSYAPSQPTPTSFRFWFNVDTLLQDDAAFAGEGASLAMVLKVVTNSTPPRTHERTLVLQVAQQ